ncbi:MAG: type II secretion system GspH family protein [bacterium]|nr:type II secretion system GspH family protein [bacterium]
MKKLGFTLAEVLITLTIIGVVAALTLPALMANTAEQQAKTALKKCINTLTEVGQMAAAVDGYTYMDILGMSKEPTDSAAFQNPDGQSFYGILARHSSVDFATTTAYGTDTSYLPTGWNAIFLRDGTAVLYDAAQALTAGSTALAFDATTGEINGIPMIIDTNGLKGPNQLSNCKGTLGGTANTYSTTGDTGTTHTFDDADTDACVGRTNANRVIKDRFSIRLRGHYAVPFGAAATWAAVETGTRRATTTPTTRTP